MLSSRPSPAVPTKGARSGAVGRFEPQPPDQEGQRDGQGCNARPVAPAADAGRRLHDALQSLHVEGEHHRVRPHFDAVGERCTNAARIEIHPLDGGPGANVDAPRREVPREGLCEPLREGRVHHVEDQALPVAQEVEVELHEQLGRREVVLRVEEGVSEDLEEHAACRWRKAERVEVVARAHAIPARRRARRVPGEHGGRTAGVGAQHVAQAERRRPVHE